MEKYKIRMSKELCNLQRRIIKLEDFINTHGSSTRFDPIQLALLKNQYEYMGKYFTILFMRCQMIFDMEEFADLMKSLNYDTIED